MTVKMDFHWNHWFWITVGKLTDYQTDNSQLYNSFAIQIRERNVAPEVKLFCPQLFDRQQ